MRNVFKGKNLTHLLYGILMLLPFCSILARVIYVQSNQNAYESYYGATINETKNVVVPYTQFKQGYTYYTQLESTTITTSLSNMTFYVTAIKDLSTDTTYDPTIYNRLRFFKNNNSTQIYTQIMRYDGGTSVTLSVNHLIQFEYLSLNNTGSVADYITFYEIQYNPDSYLDNVFDYSLSSFIQENNNYNVDFFGWFNNLFLNQSGKNLLYLNFVNWYLNYALLVSAGYILFLLFLWFINFARKLLEGGNSFGHGGF